MRAFMALLKREWLEWQRVIIWIVLIFTFLGFLALFTVNRWSEKINEELTRYGHFTIEDIKVEDDEGNDERVSVDIQISEDELILNLERESDEEWWDEGVGDEEDWEKPVIPLAYFLRFALQGLFGVVLFLALFYFADAIYKERSDNSTLFYRSLPASDHLLLGSKLVAGTLGIVGLTLFISIEFLAMVRIGIWLLRDPLATLAQAYFDQIQLAGLLGDWLVYLLAAALRLLPLMLFLMLVSAWVKGRPLLIGIGGPILAGIAFAILFRSGEFLKWMFKLFVTLNRMLVEQWQVRDVYPEQVGDLYGDFWGYIFSWETLLVLVVSGAMYMAMVWLYRRNIPVS